MKSTQVTDEGDVRCPKCGARNQFTAKRTGKAKLLVVATGGMGAVATSKKLKCMGCGTNLRAG